MTNRFSTPTPLNHSVPQLDRSFHFNEESYLAFSKDFDKSLRKFEQQTAHLKTRQAARFFSADELRNLYESLATSTQPSYNSAGSEFASSEFDFDIDVRWI